MPVHFAWNLGGAMRFAVVAPVVVFLSLLSSVQAAFIPIPTPDAAYVSGTHLLTFSAGDFFAVPLLSDGTQQVDFDVPLFQLTVPTTWASWGSPPNTESATPLVLWTNGLTSSTLT